MQTVVGRIELLDVLQSVFAGVSLKDTVDQSSCFVFRGSTVVTFNEEIFAKRRLPEGFKLKGAVAAKPLLTILNKFLEDQLTVEIQDSKLRISAKNKVAKIRLDSEILLPIDQVEKPTGDWKEVPENFSEALKIVQDCVSNDSNMFTLTCVHIHQKWVEACDNTKLTRYRIRTGVDTPFLLKRNAVKYIANLDMIEFCETDSWVHYRANNGLSLSCRRYVEDFPNLKPAIEMTGDEIILPAGVEEAVDRATVFSSENTDKNLLQVLIGNNVMVIRGDGNSGYYAERKKCQYDGPEISFYIPPALLIELVKRSSQCEVGQNKFKINGASWVFVASLLQQHSTQEEQSDD